MYAGFNDVYSVDIARSTYDPSVWRHPFTSEAMPFRETYEVTTAGPDGTMSVPSDAYVWDADADAWVTVGPGVEATSKVVFDVSKVTHSNWHHGIPITMGDILYYKASTWELAEDAEKSARESSLSSNAQAFINTIKGVVVPDEDTVEVYVDYYHFDPNEIAIFVDGGGMLGIGYNPWELMAAQEDVVFNKKTLSFDQTAADVWGIPWMSIVLGDHAEMVKDSLVELQAEDYFPSNYFTLGDTTWDTIESARARYQASIDWYDEKGILWISDGPFYLNRFDAEAQYAETKAFRDPTYPFGPGDWYYGRPAVPEVVDVSVPMITKGFEATVDITMVGPENLAATWLITDEATGELKVKKEATTTATYGELEAILTAADTDLLDVGGRYVLTVLGKSPDVAFLSDMTRRFVVRDPLIVGLGETVTELTGDIDVLSDRLGQVSTDLASAIDSLSELIGTTTADLSSTVEDASDDISAVAQSVGETNSNVEKLVSSTNTLMYAIGATLIVALIGVAASFMKK
jgi:peptide/nickel transport system substrate-binding protein